MEGARRRAAVLERRVRLTRRTVEAAAPASGEIRLWDTQVAGLCLRILPTGRRVFALKVGLGSRQRWRMIGDGHVIGVDHARAGARAILAGDEPLSSTAALDLIIAALTVAELVERYLADGPATKPAKRESTWEVDASNLRRHVVPLIGGRIAGSITKMDVARMIRSVTLGETACDVRTKPRGRAVVTGGAGTAARVLCTTAAMFSWGIEQEIVTSNPARGIRLPRRPAVERFLTPGQAARLLATLSELASRGRITSRDADILRLLLFTGARKSEILGLRWSEYDPVGPMLILPPDRTKAGEASGDRRIALSREADAIIRARERLGPYVFPAARDPGTPARNVNRAWTKVREKADLPAFRVHDLRHSFASFAIANGASLYAVGKALGHSNARTTQRYAHLTDDSLRDLAQSTAFRILGRSPTAPSSGNGRRQE